MNLEEQMFEAHMKSDELLTKLKNGEIDFNDEEVQFFIPVALHFTDFKWLKVIAENTLIEEDEKIIINFLSMVESLMEINSNNLKISVIDKLKKIMEEF